MHFDLKIQKQPSPNNFHQLRNINIPIQLKIKQNKGKQKPCQVSIGFTLRTQISFSTQMKYVSLCRLHFNASMHLQIRQFISFSVNATLNGHFSTSLITTPNKTFTFKIHYRDKAYCCHSDRDSERDNNNLKDHHSQKHTSGHSTFHL